MWQRPDLQQRIVCLRAELRWQDLRQQWLRGELRRLQRQPDLHKWRLHLCAELQREDLRQQWLWRQLRLVQRWANVQQRRLRLRHTVRQHLLRLESDLRRERVLGRQRGAGVPDAHQPVPGPEWQESVVPEYEARESRGASLARSGSREFLQPHGLEWLNVRAAHHRTGLCILLGRREHFLEYPGRLGQRRLYLVEGQS